MATQGLQAVVLNHVPFEDLGSLAQALLERGFSIETIDVATARFPLPQLESCDLLIVLGGPIGVYDSDAYPFLTHEIETIRKRLEARRPLLGVCLGAQLMAAALGSRVCPGASGAEIGWLRVQFSGTGQAPVWFAPLLADGILVFHWHGDTFDLPAGAKPLAKSDLYENQAFTVGDRALALQFHPEVTVAGLERWYVGHTCELALRKIPVSTLRQDAVEFGPALEIAAGRFWRGWLDHIL
jgi:GMP synthase (glutamine-hydrolysing)